MSAGTKGRQSAVLLLPGLSTPQSLKAACLREQKVTGLARGPGSHKQVTNLTSEVCYIPCITNHAK